MKKLLLIMYLSGIVSVISYSQIYLSLCDSTGPVANNEMKTFRGAPTVGEIGSYIFVANSSDTALSVKVKRVEISVLDSTSNYFCWGLCYGDTISESPIAVTIPPHDTNKVDFTAHYAPNGHIGISTIRYVFFDEDNRSDSVCFVVLYNTTPIGIEDQKPVKNLVRVYPNPAEKMANFEYSIGTYSESSLVIRNLLGSAVKTIKLTTGEGRFSLNTNELNDGIYFYSLIVNGETKISRKLIIKH